jgi:hypothetical protein
MGVPSRLSAISMQSIMDASPGTIPVAGRAGAPTVVGHRPGGTTFSRSMKLTVAVVIAVLLLSGL